MCTLLRSHCAALQLSDLESTVLYFFKLALLRRCRVWCLQRMNLLIKGDTSGVVEAIKGALQSLPQESVVLRYLLCAAGDITVSDVDLAAASTGMILGFNLNPDEAVLSHAKRLGKQLATNAMLKVCDTILCFPQSPRARQGCVANSR